MLLLGALLAPAALARGPYLQDAEPVQDADEAQAAEADSNAAALQRLRELLLLEQRRAADGIAALRVADASTARTVQRLSERLGALAERADELRRPALRERALALKVELVNRVQLMGDLLEDVDALAGRVASRGAAIQQRLDAQPAPRLSELVDAEVELVELADAVLPLAARSDALLQGVAKLNARVEDVHRSVAVLDVQPESSEPGPAPVDLSAVPVVELSTSLGPMVLELRPDVAPASVKNFLRLVDEGFYDGLSFYRVVSGFLAQTGCPLGDGTGGPGWTIKAEFNALHHHAGTVSMARFAHPDSAGSQFFICLGDWSGDLDGKYTVFGRLLRGRDVLDAIGDMGSETGVPVNTVIIERAVARDRGPQDVAEPPRAPDDVSGADR